MSRSKLDFLDVEKSFRVLPFMIPYIIFFHSFWTHFRQFKISKFFQKIPISHFASLCHTILSEATKYVFCCSKLKISWLLALKLKKSKSIIVWVIQPISKTHIRPQSSGSREPNEFLHYLVELRTQQRLWKGI